MNANWSLVLNVVLLFGVVIAIARMIRLRNKISKQSLGKSFEDNISLDSNSDDVISVRKVSDDDLTDLNIKISALSDDDFSEVNHVSDSSLVEDNRQDSNTEFTTNPNKSLMLFLVANNEQEFAGYELLQSLLASGLRFGEGKIFHKHQNDNGQGTILFSLAAATASGTFDLQNMDSFSVRGLCLYMHTSGNTNIDNERFDEMLAVAKNLADDLQARLLDEKQQIFGEESVDYYRSLMHCEDEEAVV